MKKFYSIITLVAAMLTLAATQAFAGGTFYAKVTAQPTATGAGKVYVSTTKTTSPEYAETSEKVGSKRTSSGDNTEITFYLYAKAEIGYEFTAWYDNAELEGDPVSTEAAFQYSAYTNSTDAEKPVSYSFYALFTEKLNTLLTAGNYKISGDVSLAEGIPASMVPEAFKKYLENEGHYNATFDLSGDEKELTIENNSEAGILNGFSIISDAVHFSPERTFSLNNKSFSVVKADEPTVSEGALSIAQESEGVYTLEDIAIVYGSAGIIGYVKNIKIEDNPTGAPVVTNSNKSRNTQTAKFIKNKKIVIVKDGRQIGINGIEIK